MYDIAAFLPQDSTGFQEHSIAPANGGRTLTGSDRVAQLFVTLLMTERGSAEGDPDRGTNFVTDLQSANSEFDLRAGFAFARDLVISQLGNQSSRPTDEQIIDASLDQVVITEDVVAIGIFIKTAAETENRIGLRARLVPRSAGTLYVVEA